MIEEINVYVIHCDECKDEYYSEMKTTYSQPRVDLEKSALNDGWEIKEENHTCPDCQGKELEELKEK